MRGIRRGKGKRFDYRTENAAHYHAQKKSRNNAGRGTLTYVYNGVATPVKTTYPQPGLALDYTVSGALDHFGRITDHAWKKGGTDVVRIQHAYDRVGNRLFREDVAATNAGRSFDELYAYDGVNQLTDMQRGKLNSLKNGLTTKNGQESFAFDATGNWNTYKLDTTGAGFALNQSRAHNPANEVVATAGTSALLDSDRNGNMTKLPKPDNWSAAFTCVFDAWNRLVQVKDGNTVIATYGYNGLNHRIKKVVGNETLLFYFKRNWQCLEEYVGSEYKTRYYWGVRYIDDLVLRETPEQQLYALQDPNWNMVALTNTSSTVLERMSYSAFGKANWFDAAFAAKASSAYGWNRTFTGQVLDSETGLMLYRWRYYHIGLGRFVSRDPIGYEAADLNTHRYTGNTPVCRIDMLGLDGEEKCPTCDDLLQNALGSGTDTRIGNSSITKRAKRCNVNIFCSDDCGVANPDIHAIAQRIDGHVHICIKNGHVPQGPDAQLEFNALLLHEMKHAEQFGGCPREPYTGPPPPLTLGPLNPLPLDDDSPDCRDCKKKEREAYQLSCTYKYGSGVHTGNPAWRDHCVEEGIFVSCQHVCPGLQKGGPPDKPKVPRTVMGSL